MLKRTSCEKYTKLKIPVQDTYISSNKTKSVYLNHTLGQVRFIENVLVSGLIQKLQAAKLYVV